MTIVISTGHVATIVTGSTQKKPTRHISPIRERDALAHIDRSAPTSRRRTTIDCRVEKKKVNKNQHAESFLPSIDIYWPGDETVGKCRKEKKKKNKTSHTPTSPIPRHEPRTARRPRIPMDPFPREIRRVDVRFAIMVRVPVFFWRAGRAEEEVSWLAGDVFVF